MILSFSSILLDSKVSFYVSLLCFISLSEINGDKVKIQTMWLVLLCHHSPATEEKVQASGICFSCANDTAHA